MALKINLACVLVIAIAFFLSSISSSEAYDVVVAKAPSTHSPIGAPISEVDGDGFDDKDGVSEGNIDESVDPFGMGTSHMGTPAPAPAPAKVVEYLFKAPTPSTVDDAVDHDEDAIEHPPTLLSPTTSVDDNDDANEHIHDGDSAPSPSVVEHNEDALGLKKSHTPSLVKNNKNALKHSHTCHCPCAQAPKLVKNAQKHSHNGVHAPSLVKNAEKQSHNGAHAPSLVKNDKDALEHSHNGAPAPSLMKNDKDALEHSHNGAPAPSVVDDHKDFVEHPPTGVPTPLPVGGDSGDYYDDNEGDDASDVDLYPGGVPAQTLVDAAQGHGRKLLWKHGKKAFLLCRFFKKYC